MVRFKRRDIAPCGLNCARCHGALRRRKPCQGCRSPEFETLKPNVKCSLRFCTKRKGAFCFRCPEFPCVTLRGLDKRYRLKYLSEPIANLEFIRARGIKALLEKEEEAGSCNGCIVCVHDGKLYKPNPPASRRKACT